MKQLKDVFLVHKQKLIHVQIVQLNIIWMEIRNVRNVKQIQIIVKNVQVKIIVRNVKMDGIQSMEYVKNVNHKAVQIHVVHLTDHVQDVFLDIN